MPNTSVYYCSLTDKNTTNSLAHHYYQKKTAWCFFVKAFVACVMLSNHAIR